MKEKIAFLYAGQGSQYTGMGQELYNSYEEFKKVFDSISLDFDIKEMCFANPDNKLLLTQYTQPCLVAFACGITEVLKSKGISPDYVCGLSLGEYSALYAANVWSLTDTMKIIAARGKAMSDASEGIDAAMVAVTGLEVNEVRDCCENAKSRGVVSICNLNCPSQVVVGGEKRAVEYVSELAKKVGAKRCIPLAVSGPFHTEFMRPAGERLAEVFNNVAFSEPIYEVLFNCLGGPRTNMQSINELLIKQIQETVHMQECIEYLINDGVRIFVEVGPGSVLSGFVKKTLKALNKNADEYRIISINASEDIEELSRLLLAE